MKYLVDSSVWLEVALEQANAPDAARFLQQTPIRQLAVSLFALHSIGVLLVRKRRPEIYSQFLQETVIAGKLTIVSLNATELRNVIEAAGRHSLDFDDAYQFIAAEQHNLTIVRFGAHFDRTPRGRKTPGELSPPEHKDAADAP